MSAPATGPVRINQDGGALSASSLPYLLAGANAGVEPARQLEERADGYLDSVDDG